MRASNSILQRGGFLFFFSLAAAGCLGPGCSGLSYHEGKLEPVAVSFDSAETGAVPPDFSTALTGEGGPPVWAVREEPVPPDGAKVLVQESAEEKNYRFPLCIYEKAVARDAAAEVEFEPISGKLDQAGGIVLRYRPGNYYIARANALENNVILFKTVAGKRSKILEVPATVAPGRWHRLRFEARGRRLTIQLDGRVVIDTNDPTFSNPGKIGLWTKADSVSAFANLKIEPIP